MEQGGVPEQGVKPNLDDITNTQIAHAIDEYIHNERDRAMLKRRLIDGICFEPLADEFNLSVRHTKNIIYRAESQLFRHL